MKEDENVSLKIFPALYKTSDDFSHSICFTIIIY